MAEDNVVSIASGIPFAEYPDTPVCIKCEADGDAIECDYTKTTTGSEFLLWECGYCGYKWTTPCADHKTP
jgi:hypothetical protein